MRNDNARSIFATIENFIDLFLNAAAFAMAFVLTPLFVPPSELRLESPYTLISIFVTVVVQAFVFLAFNTYRPIPFVRASKLLWQIAKVNLVFFAALELIVLFMVRESEKNFVLMWVFVAFIISTGILVFKKNLIISLARFFRRTSFNLRKVIVVGDNTATAADFVRQVANNPDCGMLVVGYVGDKIDGDAIACDKLGAFRELGTILDTVRPDDVVFAIDAYDKRHLIRLVNMCDDRCIKVYFLPVIYGFFKVPRQIETIGSLPIINIHSTPLDSRFNAFVKRCIDIVGSLALILLTSPIMLVAAIGVALSSPGPIFFMQERVGKMGKRFMMLKFRSMRVNVTSDRAWSTGEDPRKTKFGNFLRMTSIDELPQLFNVLLGHMSLVGPRPEIPKFVDYFKDIIPLYMVKHYVKPGMTGLAQVRGLRGDTSVEERIHADIEYIENWSLLMDIMILLKTPFKAINKQEKYTPEATEAKPATEPHLAAEAAVVGADGEPANADGKPANTDGKPTDADGKPANADGKPANADGKPVDDDGKPVDADEKPVDADGKPTDADGKPTDADEKPVDADEKPVDADGVMAPEELVRVVEEEYPETLSHVRGKILYAASTMSHINNFHLEYISALRAEGYVVKVIARGDGADYNIPFEKKFFSQDNAACRAEIKKIIADEKFDIIILNTSLAAFHIRLCLPKTNRPRVINLVHGYLFSRDVGFIKRQALLFSERFLASRTDSIIVMNEWDRQVAERYKLCRGNVYFCRGMGAAVTPQKISPEKLRRETQTQDKYVLCFVGELSDRKNQQFLIHALNEIKEHIPQAVLWLVGDGLGRDKLEGVAERVDLSASVEFLGRRENACDYMRACDLYVSASTIEGMPFNLIEAMGCGKTVLASRVKGHSDLIEEGKSGYLYELDNMEQFVGAVVEIYRGERKLESENITARYHEFAKETVFEDTLEVIRRSITE